MRQRKRVGVIILFLIVSAATVVALSPGDSTETSAIAVESNGASAPGTAGMRVYLDPETGEIAGHIDAQAAIELDAELQEALRHDDEGLTTVRHEDGAESLDLNGRYQEASVVRLDASGKFVVCTDNIANLKRALKDTTPAAPEVK